MHSRIFETHAHYEDEKYDTDREALIASLPEHNIEYVINVGSSLETTQKSIALAEQYDFIYAAVGVHPSDVAELNEKNFKELEQAADFKKTVAIGEIGLDYYWDKEQEVQENQRFWFRRQLALAKEKDLPVIIHSRDAAEDTMQILKETPMPEEPGVIHCYSYSVEMAREFVKMGYYIGVGGVVTFKNAKKLRAVVEEVPLTRMLLETDCPYMAPEPHRGERNCSLFIPYIVEKIAEIRNISTEEVLQTTNTNAKKLFARVN